jgi:GNAT superfamily N-acetyltransferase
MSLSIRKAVAGDESLILGFIRDLAAYEKLSDAVTATPEHLTRTLFADQPKVFALIAERDGAPAGFALYFFNYSTFLGMHGLYLEDLYVREEARGSGAGTALLAELAKIAIDQHCGRMEWSVLDWNTPSINFYKALGAEAMDEWTVYRLTGAALSRLAGKARP